MIVERRHPGRLSERSADERYDVAIVMDVLRASSTAAVLLDRVDEIAVVARPDALAQLAPRSWLMVSELAGVGDGGRRIDNSPTQAAAVALGADTPCLVTTNGTRALCAAATRAPRVLLAGFVNLRATVAAVLAAGPARVLLLPAGSFASGEQHHEDEACADALGARLRGEAIDEAALCASVRVEPRVMRRVAKEVGLATDIDLALSIDCFARAAEFVPIDAGAGWLRRVG